jgi:hypothetical protein
MKILLSFLITTVMALWESTTQEEQGTNSHTVEDWKTFDQTDYSIQYPASWELNDGGQMGMSFAILSPPESGQDNFRENVNLLIQDLTGHNIDLKKYTEISEKQIETYITNSALIENNTMNEGGKEYQKLIYTGDQGMFHLKCEQYYFVVHEKAYVLTFTSEQMKFESFRHDAERILNSFTLKN